MKWQAFISLLFIILAGRDWLIRYHSLRNVSGHGYTFKMKLFISLLFIGNQALALAPPPVNFTHEVVEVKGKKYDVEFDGRKIKLKRHESGSHLVAIILLLAMLFWGSVIGYVLYRTGHLLDGVIFLLIVILVGHIIYTFKK